MYNLLIIEENLKLALKISNYISENFQNIRICSICTTEEEAINVINNKVPDLIIMDLDLIHISVDNILTYLETNKKENYKNLIVLKNNTLIQSKIEKSICFSSYYNKNLEISELKNNIQKFLNFKNEKKTIKEKINYELHKINFNFNYIGTTYLSDCIFICSTLIKNTNEINVINLTKEVFPIIANKYKTEINNVKTNINRSTTNMYYDCNEQYLNKYCNSQFDSKPSLKILICAILNKI